MGHASEPAGQISFTRAELNSFTGATLADLIAEGVRLLFVGINPGLRSVAVQGHFAPRGNRFYPALLRAGITDHLIVASAGLSASDRDYLLGRGVGITSLIARATASADELGPAELAEGARALAGKVRRCRHARHHRRRDRVRVATGAARSPSASGSAERAIGGRMGGRGLLGSRTPARPGPPRRRTKGTCSQTQASPPGALRGVGLDHRPARGGPVRGADRHVPARVPGGDARHRRRRRPRPDRRAGDQRAHRGDARRQGPPGAPDRPGPRGMQRLRPCPWPGQPGPAILGQNWDWLLHSARTLVVLEARPDQGPDFVTVVTDADAGEPRLPYHVLLRAVLDCATVTEALKVLQAGPRSSSANYLIAHASGAALDIEAAPGDFTRLYPLFPEDGTLLHTNHFLTPHIDPTDLALWAMPSSVVRLQRLRAARNAARNTAPALDDFRTLLADHADYPHSICAHPDPARCPTSGSM